MKATKTMITVLALTAIAGTAAAGDFGTLDANANGEVDFQEYKAHALKDGKTVTLVAQEFTSMTQGDATLTEVEFLMAEANAAQTVDFSSNLIATPMAAESFETVAPAEIFVDAPQEVEAMESDSFEMETDARLDTEIEADTAVESDMSEQEVPSESMTSTIEIEVGSEVAGEVTTSDRWTAPEITVPEISVPEINVPEIAIEPDTALDIALDAETDAEDDIEIPQAPELPDAPVID